MSDRYKSTLIDLIKAYGSECNIENVESLYLDREGLHVKAGTVSKDRFQKLYDESWERRNTAATRRVSLLAQIVERVDALSAKADGFDLYRNTLQGGRH